MVIRRIGVASVAKVSGVLYAMLGLLVGAGFALVSLVGLSIGATSADEPAWLGAAFGVGAIIFFPVFYGVIGFLGGALMAWLYNVCAGMVGGVTVEAL